MGHATTGAEAHFDLRDLRGAEAPLFHVTIAFHGAMGVQRAMGFTAHGLMARLKPRPCKS